MAHSVVRIDPLKVSDERTSLTMWLDFQRTTLQQKCEGLSGAQLVQASVPPSNLTLLGLVRHMTLVEFGWFEEVFLGSDVAEPFDTHGDVEYEFTHLDPSNVEIDLSLFEAQCENSRRITAEAGSLDALSVSPKRPTRDLRWILVHMIEEYARHNGHADLLREAIDGVVGD